MPVDAPRLKSIWPWLTEARFAWLALGVIGIAMVVSLRPHTPESVIRWTGLVLQLLGIGTVGWGISETRALFGHPSFASKVKGWLGRFPLLRRHLAHGAMTSSLAAVSGKARGFVRKPPGPNATIDARVEALERNIELIHQRISDTENEMDAEFRKTNDALKEEQQARKSDDIAILEKLEVTGTGGVHISAIGASWLFVGVVLSTAAIEISEWLK